MMRAGSARISGCLGEGGGRTECQINAASPIGSFDKGAERIVAKRHVVEPPFVAEDEAVAVICKPESGHVGIGEVDRNSNR